MSVRTSDRIRELLARAGLGGLSPRVAAGALAACLLVSAVGLWRFWPRAPEPEVAFEEPTGGESAVGGGEDAAREAAVVVVHVVGSVLHPGVYTLPQASRVADAITSAGGPLSSADLTALNLARVLTDGEQVYVPAIGETAADVTAGRPGGGSAIAADGTVNINTASATELETLPGVGPSTAEKIVSDREANGPFSAPEDLMRVPGIGPKKFEALKDLVSVR
jgi:competence protein ComEA